MKTCTSRLQVSDDAYCGSQVLLVVVVVVKPLRQVGDVSLVAPSLSQLLEQVFHQIIELEFEVFKHARVIILAQVLLD